MEKFPDSILKSALIFPLTSNARPEVTWSGLFLRRVAMRSEQKIEIENLQERMKRIGRGAQSPKAASDEVVHRQRQRAGCFWGAHTGPNPTDRAKAGCKRHVLTEAEGLPLVVR